MNKLNRIQRINERLRMSPYGIRQWGLRTLARRDIFMGDAERILFMIYILLADEEGKCQPHKEFICAYMNRVTATLERTREKLVKKGLITTDRVKSRQPLVIQLCWKTEAEDAVDETIENPRYKERYFAR